MQLLMRRREALHYTQQMIGSSDRIISAIFISPPRPICQVARYAPATFPSPAANIFAAPGLYFFPLTVANMLEAAAKTKIPETASSKGTAIARPREPHTLLITTRREVPVAENIQ
mmetsp:Transcript_21076/g.53184  ORF Transcript_21076/g.53184 Transcript_21076/m.53184 type:complete len:115 (+) Transcript_21076:52-396(+)